MTHHQACKRLGRAETARRHERATYHAWADHYTACPVCHRVPGGLVRPDKKCPQGLATYEEWKIASARHLQMLNTYEPKQREKELSHG